MSSLFAFPSWLISLALCVSVCVLLSLKRVRTRVGCNSTNSISRESYGPRWLALDKKEQRQAEVSALLNWYGNSELDQFRAQQDERLELKKRLRKEWAVLYGPMVVKTGVLLSFGEVDSLFDEMQLLSAREIEHQRLPQLLFTRCEYQKYVVQCARFVADTPPASSELCLAALSVVIKHSRVSVRRERLFLLVSFLIRLCGPICSRTCHTCRR